MAKKIKKRNKTYSGSNAAKQQPIITRVDAVKRSKLNQWWYENKKRAKVITIISLIFLIIIWLIVALFKTF